MNIFYLDHDVHKCAEMHNDKHVVKMVIEYAQLMSTAHRLLDGKEYYDLTANGRKIKRWLLPDELEDTLMKASHVSHPSNIWTRQNDSNYTWLYQMWIALCKEYTHRYGKIHSVETRLAYALLRLPNNISKGAFTEPTPAMPDDCKILKEIHIDRYQLDSLLSYRNYYIKNKTHLAKWKNRSVPQWYAEGTLFDAHI